MANVIEEAKSGRASCRTCRKAIAKGELRFGEEAASGFGDEPQLRWHHLACAAEKLPAELRAVLGSYAGEVPDRAALDKKIDDALAGGRGKPGGFPYADKAPTGRAKCIECKEPIAQGSTRVAIERELETGTMVTRGAGYMHPACVKPWAAKAENDLHELVAGVRANSRLTDGDLNAVVDAIDPTS